MGFPHFSHLPPLVGILLISERACRESRLPYKGMTGLEGVSLGKKTNRAGVWLR